MASTEHYVDNKQFLQALIDFRKAQQDAKKRKGSDPAIPEYIGECFLKIATNLAFKPNFALYTYREDMIADGVENCCQYMRNFDPKKSSNPFGYFTQIIYYAFLRRIEREKKQTYIKYKVAERAHVTHEDFQQAHGQRFSGEIAQPYLDYDNMKSFVDSFEERQAKKRRIERDGPDETPIEFAEETVDEPVSVED